MKLVIETQYRENYGAHDWDGEGECPQYWKMKGGSTYVYLDINPNDVRRIVEQDIPTLTTLIESADYYSQEYIIDWSFKDDDDVVCEEWETPWVLDFALGNWTVSRTSNHSDYWNKNVPKKVESYCMAEGGEKWQTSYP